MLISCLDVLNCRLFETQSSSLPDGLKQNKTKQKIVGIFESFCRLTEVSPVILLKVGKSRNLCLK